MDGLVLGRTVEELLITYLGLPLGAPFNLMLFQTRVEGRFQNVVNVEKEIYFEQYEAYSN